MKLLRGAQAVVTSTAIVVALYIPGHVRCAAQTVVGVGTCGELQHAVELAKSGDTNAALAPDGVSCDEWTTFEIENNTFQLVGQEGGGSLGKYQVYALENVRFLVSSGVLESDVALSFTTGADNRTQEVDGGVLNVAQGARASFESGVFMKGVTVEGVPREEGSIIVTSDKWYGGCIYNQGSIRFEEYLQASHCATGGRGASIPGNGGGVFNGKSGDIVFNGKAKFTDCGTTSSKGNRGGAIYNEGEITLLKTSKFFDNAAAAGGAIFNEGEMNVFGKHAAKFRGNRSYGNREYCDSGKDGGRGYSGGQVLNTGSMMFEGGVVFEDGRTEGFGGAIGNYGSVIIKTSASFQRNSAGCMGGAISTPSNATFELLQDARFQDNSVAYDEAMCENWVEVAYMEVYPEVVVANSTLQLIWGVGYKCHRDMFWQG